MLKRSSSNKQPQATRKPPDLGGELTVCADVLARLADRDVRLERLRIEETPLTPPALGNLQISECLLRRVVLANSTIAIARFRDVRFEDCDLANVEVRALEATRVEFVNCRMTGFRSAETKCQDLLIAEGDQRYAQFRLAKFKTSEFDSCNFEEADFQGADLTGCRMRRSNLTNVEMTGAKLKDADLRSSTIDGLRLNASDLRGAIVDAAQALSLAHLLGIRIL